MADRASCHLYIGGDVPRSALPGLFKAIAEESVEEGHVTTEQELLNSCASDGCHHLAAYEVRGGMMETLETYLRRNSIAYVRYSGGCVGAFEAEVSFFLPGTVKETSLLTTEEGYPVIPGIVAVEAFEALAHGNVHLALTVLEPYKDYKVPELPPLRIVD